MTNEPWTPGPWFASRVMAAEEGTYTIRNPEARPVARIAPAGGTTQPDADARLIAAGPEMAALLEKCLSTTGSALPPGVYARGRRLLARIRGETEA